MLKNPAVAGKTCLIAHLEPESTMALETIPLEIDPHEGDHLAGLRYIPSKLQVFFLKP